MNPEKALVDLQLGLDEAGARWYLFGAQAAMLYGRPRLTQDIDVTVDFPLEQFRDLLTVLARHRLALREGVSAEFVLATRILPLLHAPSATSVDLVLAGGGIEQTFLARARRLRVGAVEVPVITLEDLLITKVFAGRPKDLEDAGNVLAANPSRVDLDHVRHWLGLLEQALDRRDLLAELDRLLDRTAREPRG